MDQFHPPDPAEPGPLLHWGDLLAAICAAVGAVWVSVEPVYRSNKLHMIAIHVIISCLLIFGALSRHRSLMRWGGGCGSLAYGALLCMAVLAMGASTIGNIFTPPLYYGTVGATLLLTASAAYNFLRSFNLLGPEPRGE